MLFGRPLYELLISETDWTGCCKGVEYVYPDRDVHELYVASCELDIQGLQ